MDINRSGFYKWLNRKTSPSKSVLRKNNAYKLFEKYHALFPSHGYRWLNAKIRLDTNEIYSDNYAYRICKQLGIKSKHYKCYNKRTNDELKQFPNYILSSINPSAPFEVVVSNITTLWANQSYYELMLYMDLFNNEIAAYSLLNKKENYKTCQNRQEIPLKKKEEYKDLETILYSDQGFIYSSKKFNESQPKYTIIHDMSKFGKSTKNRIMKAINSWMKEEFFIDFKIDEKNNVYEEIEKYIDYFNSQRPQISLNYLTPYQFKEKYK